VSDVLVLGGYGNFGKRIAAALARHQVPVTIAGRDLAKGQALAAQLQRLYPTVAIRAVALDALSPLDAHLQALGSRVVINSCGPFQNRDYAVAEACIRNRVHSIDLADGRAFVTGISQMDAAAKAAGISVISGASTVPGLSSAVLDHYRPEFSEITALKFGITPGQKAERGFATTQGILTYVGKPLRAVQGDVAPRYGWQDIYRQIYPILGARWMANCDIPDLDLFPSRYGIRRIQFSAGMESTFLHFGIFALSWLVRWGLPLDLPRHAGLLLKLSHCFDFLGGQDGGMHLVITGKDHQGRALERQWFIIAKNGDGPQIPCVPAILLAKRLINGTALPSGAVPCVGLLTLSDYLEELTPHAITTVERSLRAGV
jgi:NAD(P)-dependent dehydrogenase (short-subunit alcohol dehydrogenase family)